MQGKSFRNRLNLAYLRLLLRTPEGRKHVLSQVADAEHSGEARVFESMLAYTAHDAALARRIAKHRDDEIRHEALFRACVARQGGSAPELPSELMMMNRLDAAVGFITRPIEDDRGVMEAYLVLQVLEERAVEQFALFIEAFRAVDPETARVFRDVARDEERHLRYCHAISARYAPEEATRRARLAELRRIEAQVYQDSQEANLHYTLEHGFIESAVVRATWRAIGKAASTFGELPYTRFAAADLEAQAA